MKVPAGWILLALYNAVIIAVYGWDKLRARRGGRRTPESTLLWLATCFGAAGALLAIRLFRHKSRKPRFAVGVPLMLMAQVGLILWGWSRGWW